MSKRYDCVVCGSCCVDVLVRPVRLTQPLGVGTMTRVSPIVATTGGLVSNSGIALARLGMDVAAFSYTGADHWSDLIRRTYQAEGIATSHLEARAEQPTGVTVVLVDDAGERSFAYHAGAAHQLTGRSFVDNLDLFAASRVALFGYYALIPGLDRDLVEAFPRLRAVGCQTAMDAVGDGGTMEPLAELLPHLDYYIPSVLEARHQTGEDDPRRMIDVYRACGAPGVLGVKLGIDGALLSSRANDYVEVACVPAPGPVVDTTGAGDSFYAGLLAGLRRGLSLAHAGRLAAACGACCVTGEGASSALRDWQSTCELAGLC